MNRGVRLVLAACALAGAAACGGSPELVLPNADEGGTVQIVPTGAGGSASFIKTDPDASYTNNLEAGPLCGDACLGPVDAGPVCGDGMVEEGESCDDGNARGFDGCSNICRVEGDFACPTPGMLCISTIVCGDSKKTGNEDCDDGNSQGGDGCSSVCQKEPGFDCNNQGQACTPSTGDTICGDSKVSFGENCDDGAKADNDGCSSTCMRESGWRCPTAGQPCVKIEDCGDGVLNGIEACDDGNTDVGDGCSGLCLIEPFFECKMPGKPCTTTIICGDGKVIGPEACDDGNAVGMDGCAANCLQSDPGYTCPRAAGVGGACIAVPTARCGDSIIQYGEFCDDGNTSPSDGCSSACKVEAGYTCPGAGMACQRIGACGDGALTSDEDCDDHNVVGNDGCSPQCTVEPNFICPQPGTPCVSTVKCGDKKITGNETCDDGNTAMADGCSPTCTVEPGWICPSGSFCRAAACGDGYKAGAEECDDKNIANNDGCTSTCKLEGPPNGQKDGWVCPTPGLPCVRTTCGAGNGVVQGSEQCDDGNNKPFDGCSWNCTKEPTCGYDTQMPAQYGCSKVCGDGMVFPGEGCDDGNTRPGDGCEGNCTITTGWDCTPVRPPLPNPLYMPVVYRDMQETHPQFEIQPDPNNHRQFGIANAAIGTNGKPSYNSAFLGVRSSPPPPPANMGRPWTMDGPAENAGSAIHLKDAGNAASLTTAAQIQARYAEWYTDVVGVNQTFQDLLQLNLDMADGKYKYYNAAFFPLDGKGYGNLVGTPHNFNFTSEVRYWFQYQGGERLEFRGDDDVWVFVNGQLSVDLGGIHGELRGIVTLNGATTQYCVDEAPPPCAGQLVCDTPAPATCTTVPSGFNLVKDNVYEIAVFQAERHVNGSNYKLTLSGFNVPKSVCTPHCGDGIVVGNEACDLGAGNTGLYGTCNANCTLTPRCGDAIVNGPELCDDGLNITTYNKARKCGPGCVWAPFCGDSVISNGEICDDGASNGVGYNKCQPDCTLGARCGDGFVSDGESCDDGVNNGTTNSLCRVDCKFKCGDGVIDPGEQCDKGAANNNTLYDGCKLDCTLGPRCGDGVKTPNEVCDDGKNDGSYGTCAPMCVAPPRCGDGVVQSTAGEVCDQGVLNDAAAYGAGKCLKSCRPAPYCGDKSVDVGQGEACDDGVNSGMPGSCTVDCKGYVPLPSCGDGTKQPPEQCDDGSLSNGQPASTCDGHCRFKCGNGFKDTGEECDDGVNNGAYGTCKSDCKLAGYCGDNLVNGPEQCDKGAGNLASPYGPNTCTLSCAIGPYCGDGRIDPSHQEECDGTLGCDSACKISVVR